ncbi:MAG: dephospho-CoA kinase [Chloroflexi bacterium]|nr:dephospho-CoA kinase [Chloroflexota bacterium]
MAYRIGLTGNIGCGKSSVGEMLQALGAEYIDADRVVHELYRPRSPESERVVARFGPAILGPDGTIDRRKLGQIVFRDPQALKDLEALLVPEVRARVRRRVAASTAPAVVVDAIKLLESGLADEMDAVWVVTCTPEQQVQRLMETRGYSRQEAEARIAAQPPQEGKVERADVVIDNSATLEQLRRQVERIWAELVPKVQGQW